MKVSAKTDITIFVPHSFTSIALDTIDVGEVVFFVFRNRNHLKSSDLILIELKSDKNLGNKNKN